MRVEMDEAIGSEPVMMTMTGTDEEGPEKTRVQLSVVTDGWERRLIARHLDGAVLWDDEVPRQAGEREIREFFRRFGIEVGWLVIEKRRALHPELAPVEAMDLTESGEIVTLPVPVVLDESGELELPA